MRLSGIDPGSFPGGAGTLLETWDLVFSRKFSRFPEVTSLSLLGPGLRPEMPRRQDLVLLIVSHPSIR